MLSTLPMEFEEANQVSTVFIKEGRGIGMLQLLRQRAYQVMAGY
jgi:hypothetical protein